MEVFNTIPSRRNREVKRPSLVQQELQKQQMEAMMSTAPSSAAETKGGAEGEPAVAKFQLSNVGLKVVVSTRSRRSERANLY